VGGPSEQVGLTSQPGSITVHGDPGQLLTWALAGCPWLTMQNISESSEADEKGALKVGQVFCSVLYTAHPI